MSDDFVAYLRALAKKHPRTVRSAARMRQPLDGADAQALEGALCSTERERNEALAEVERLTRELNKARTEVENLYDQVHRWVDDRAKAQLQADRLREQNYELQRKRDEARAEVERLREALRKAYCACSAITECVSAQDEDGNCPHFRARKELEAKP